MSEKPPSWRPYDAPGDDPGQRIEPENPLPGEEPAGPPSVGAAPFPVYGDASSRSPVPPVPQSRGRSAGHVALVAGGVASTAVAIGIAMFVLTDSSLDPDIAGIGGDAVAGRPDMHSQEALDDLVRELRDEHGSSKVFEATFYPDRAYVELHVPGGSGQRYDSYSWDGSLDEWGSSGTDDGATFDLRDLDGDRFDDFCDVARTLVEDPGDCYIIVSAPDPNAPPQLDGWYRAHVSNDYSEGGYVLFDRDGEEVTRTTW